MCCYVAFILLVFVGKILADEPPLIPSRLLKADVEGAVSIYRIADNEFDPSIPIRGFLQYLSHELFLERLNGHDGPWLSITCAGEGLQCRYYDTATQTWGETEDNKIYYDGAKFFELVDKNIRVYFENNFLLLLTVEKQDRVASDYSFLMTYKDAQTFLRENGDALREDNDEIEHLKGLYVDDAASARVEGHPVFHAKMMLDAILKKEGDTEIFQSSLGVSSFSGLLAIRELERAEYLFQYARRNYEHEIFPVMVTSRILKKDFISLDPENRCQKREVSTVGFLELKNVFLDVFCEKKKYAFHTAVRYDGKEFDAHITCSKELFSDRKYRCTLKETTNKICSAVSVELKDDDRIQLVPQPPRKASLTTLSNLVKLTKPMVHYFQLDDFFKQKLLAMQKLLKAYGVHELTEITFHVPSLGRRDFTVPVTFGCREGGGIEIVKDLVVFDDNLMDHFNVPKLLFNPETDEFESPGRTFERRNPRAIRLVGSWQSMAILSERATRDIPLHHILEDLKKLREEYLEEAAANPEAEKALKMNKNVLLIVHGEDVIDGVKAVLIQAQILCRYFTYTDLVFNGEELKSYDSKNREWDIIDPKKCFLKNENLPGKKESNFVMGITHVTEDNLSQLIHGFVSTIDSRCKWLDINAVIRVVIHTPEGLPVIDGLFHCSTRIYLLRGSFKVLTESGSEEEVENVFVIVNEGVLVTPTHAFVVKVFSRRPIAGIDSMGPPIKMKDKWAISMQELSI